MNGLQPIALGAEKSGKWPDIYRQRTFRSSRQNDSIGDNTCHSGLLALFGVADSIGFRGWWTTCVNNRMIPPLALYCVWSKQRRRGSQRHGTIPRKESLCAVRE